VQQANHNARRTSVTGPSHLLQLQALSSWTNMRGVLMHVSMAARSYMVRLLQCCKAAYEEHDPWSIDP